MTDDLDQDLRTLLAAKAASVTPDVAAGEQTIATRLQSGDQSLADVVPLAEPTHRRWYLAAAAAVVAVIAIGALALRDDGGVQTGPVATPTTIVPGPPVQLELAPVNAMLPACDGLTGSVVRGADGTTCWVLGTRVDGQGFVKAAGVIEEQAGTCAAAETACVDGTGSTLAQASYSVSLTLTDDGIDALNEIAGHCYAKDATCPTGQLAIVIDGKVQSAPSIQQPAFEADQIQLSGFPTFVEARRVAAGLVPRAGSTTTTSPTDDPLDARDGESAKDLAERVARQLFPDDEYVTRQVEDGPIPASSPGTKVVTMDGSTAYDTLVAYVTLTPAGTYRLATLTSPELDGHLTTELTDFVLTGIQLNGVELPAGRAVVLVLRGLDADLVEVGRDEAQVRDQRADVSAPWLAKASYLAVEIRAEDGTLLRAMQPVPTAE